jgi:hypothetical protein
MENAEIKNILLSMGLFSLALAYAGSEAELMRMFVDDFDGLMRVCAEGV